MPLQLNEAVAEEGAEVIDHPHDQVDCDNQSDQSVLREEANGDLDLLVESPGGHVAQDDHLPDVDLPAVERVGDVAGEDL